MGIAFMTVVYKILEANVDNANDASVDFDFVDNSIFWPETAL